MSIRRALMLAGAVLWLGLAGVWLWRGPAPEEGTDWLAIAVAVLPLMLIYELWTMAAESLRRRRQRDREDA